MTAQKESAIHKAEEKSKCIKSTNLHGRHGIDAALCGRRNGVSGTNNYYKREKKYLHIKMDVESRKSNHPNDKVKEAKNVLKNEQLRHVNHARCGRRGGEKYTPARVVLVTRKDGNWLRNKSAP